MIVIRYPIETVPVSVFCAGGTGVGSTVIPIAARGTPGLVGVSSPHAGSSRAARSTKARREVLLIVIVAQAFGAGGASSAASQLELKPTRLCEPSQNGFLADCPQRHSETTVRPARPHSLPLSSSDRDGSFEAERTVVPDSDLEIGHEAIILVAASRGVNSTG